MNILPVNIQSYQLLHEQALKKRKRKKRKRNKKLLQGSYMHKHCILKLLISSHSVVLNFSHLQTFQFPTS